MIDEILPHQAACSEAFDDIPDAPLYPEEKEQIARSVPRRRGEFITARHCARRALSTLGVAPVAIPTGTRGAPCWPPGIVGTITHCAGYRAAVVAHATHLASIGIDAEPHDALPDGVLSSISLPAEQRHLADLGSDQPDIHWGRLLFCAKEAVYKAWYPMTERWLGFSEAMVTIRPTSAPGRDAADGARRYGTFSAALTEPATALDGHELTGFSGRWLIGDGLILTAVTVGRNDQRG